MSTGISFWAEQYEMAMVGVDDGSLLAFMAQSLFA